MLSNSILDLSSSSTPGVEPFEPWLSSLPLELAFQVIASSTSQLGLWLWVMISTKWICSSWITTGSDICLGNFNEHLQWLQPPHGPHRASITLTNCCLFYITVSLVFYDAVSRLIRILSKVMLFWVYCIFCDITIRTWAPIFQYQFS